jgi:hypothetical protein
MTIPALKPLEIADLEVIRQRLSRYAAGEIAHIENVMAKEERKRSHRLLNEIETTLTHETEREQERKHDLETTERFEIENEIKREIQNQEKFSAGLELSGGFGPVQISAYARYDRSSSATESEKAAQKYSKEITEKAMERVKERVLEQRTRKERTETEEINKHNFKNDGDASISGVYRWVDKYYRVKTVNYGKRLFYEIVLPEPAALLLFSRTWHLENRELPLKPSEPSLPKLVLFGREFDMWYDPVTASLREGDPGPLRPGQIFEGNYAFLSSEYGAEGVKPPPAKTIFVTHSISRTFDPSADWALDSEEIAVPDKYEAVSCQYNVTLKTWASGGETSPGNISFHPYPAGWPGFARIHIGTAAIAQWRYYDLLGEPLRDNALFTVPLSRERSIVPITGVGNRVGALAMNLEVECERTEEAMQEWQMATYRAILTAYNKRMSDYQQKLTAARVASGVTISSDNPDRNLLTIKEELKRQFLKVWMGADPSVAAVTDGDAGRVPPVLPDLLPAGILANNDRIAFAEEAFDWENISFRLLPYFHGRQSKWIELSNYTDTDPVFANFLRAGAALVRVPVSPQYTHAVLYFQLTGNIWSRTAGEVPSLSETSAAPELVELYNGYLAEVVPEGEDTDIHRPIEILDDDPETFEIKVPTSLIWLQPGSELNPPVGG